MKGALGLRPVFHHREDRIRAHIQLCWLALLLLRVIENAAGDTWRNVRHELDRTALVTLATDHGQVAQRSATTPAQRTPPTSGSWLNMVEIFFGIITRQAIRRGTYNSVDDLIEAINEFINGWNDRCHPFIWTKDADTIIAKAHRKSTPGTGH